AREDYLAKSEREKAATLEAMERATARRRTLLRLLGFVVVAIIFLLLYFGLELFIARDSRKRR
ncbi:ankyrin repeat-containing protein, partial [Toxoplasma gondii ARI]